MSIVTKKCAIGALVGLSVVACLWLYFSVSKKPGQIQTTPLPTEKGGANYRNLTPGISSKEEVVKKLGEPLKTGLENGTETLEYNSNNPNLNNKFFINNGVLSLVKEIVTLKDKIKIPSIKEKYGDPVYTLFGPGSTIGFYLYIYPDKGFAYVGHEKSGLIKEIWYFPPTNFESFRKNYAPEYSDTLRPIQ